MAVLIDRSQIAVVIRTALRSGNDVIHLSSYQWSGLALTVIALA